MNQELRQRIRRPESNPQDGTAVGAENNVVPPPRDDEVPPPPPLIALSPQMIRISVLLHILAVLVYVSGFILRSKFHSGVECEMTYSMRHFLKLENNVPKHPVYNLFKFTDLRDARQAHLLQSYTGNEWSSMNATDWCTLPKNSTTTIVLYIPGHWGSFSQARSLGAHGLGWTRQYADPKEVLRQVDLMESGEWNGKSTDVSNFVYDVYAIDFAEQGGGLHADLLLAQTEYVAQVVMALVEQCHNPNILLVGHSIGGLVAKAVPLLYPETKPHLHSLVTLATPHVRLPYCFDMSLTSFYEMVRDHEENPLTTVSISGGLRDEMLPPEVCRIKNDNNKSMS